MSIAEKIETIAEVYGESEEFIRGYLQAETGTQKQVQYIQTTDGPYQVFYVLENHSEIYELGGYSWLLAEKVAFAGGTAGIKTPTEAGVAQNVAYVECLYEIFNEVQSETAGMSEYEKAEYSIQKTNGLIRNIQPYESWAYYLGPSLAHGQGCCSAKRLFYDYVAKSAGLRCELVTGHIKGIEQGHGWNRVWIDGQSYIIDTTCWPRIMTEEEAKTIYTEDKGEEC